VTTEGKAEVLMREAEAAFSAADVERILRMFAADVVVRYAGLPEIRGLDAYAEHLQARFERQRDYQACKTLRAVAGEVVVDSWDATWLDGVTGARMRGRGMEVLELREGRVQALDAVFSTWQDADG
jgi:nuclear transport factor 2 (NTF2) superfamily protein